MDKMNKDKVREVVDNCRNLLKTAPPTNFMMISVSYLIDLAQKYLDEEIVEKEK